MKRRFVAIDRDGTLIIERHYLSDPAGVELFPGAAAGLRRLRSFGLGLIVVTNQSGVGRGYFDLDRLNLIHLRMTDLLAAEGVSLDGIYYCPHIPEDHCLCRKPAPGMLLSAAQAHKFVLQEAFVIGDKECDLQLGRSVGASTILVCTGYGSKTALDSAAAHADYVVDDLEGAAAAIDGELSR